MKKHLNMNQTIHIRGISMSEKDNWEDEWKDIPTEEDWENLLGDLSSASIDEEDEIDYDIKEEPLKKIKEAPQSELSKMLLWYREHTKLMYKVIEWEMDFNTHKVTVQLSTN